MEIFRFSLLLTDFNLVFAYVSLSPFVEDLHFKVRWQDIVGATGLLSANPLDQQTAMYSLSTLMTVAPSDTYMEFEKVKCGKLLMTLLTTPLQSPLLSVLFGF